MVSGSRSSSNSPGAHGGQAGAWWAAKGWWLPAAQRPQARSASAVGAAASNLPGPQTWEKQVLSARGFKRAGRHSEYAI